MRDSRPIKNLLMTVLVVGFFGGLAALGTLASFVSTTSNQAWAVAGIAMTMPLQRVSSNC